MSDNRVKLLFPGVFEQCLHCHTKFSYEVDGEADTGLFRLLDIIREKNDSLKCYDRIYSSTPVTMVAITDHNCIDAYLGLGVDEIKTFLNKSEITFKELATYYALTEKERKRIELEEKIKIITGGEFSAVLAGFKVHTLGLDFDDKFMRWFRYTRKKYRFDGKHRHSVKAVARAVHFSGGKFVLAHPSRYVKEGRTLNDVLEAAKNAGCFDGIECATSNTTIEECFEILRFCATNNIPVTIGSDYHYAGRRTVKGMPGQRKDIFFIESLGMSSGDFLRMVSWKNVEQLNEIEKSLIMCRDGFQR